MCHMFAGQAPEAYECITRSIRLNGQSTSIRLEAAFWVALEDIAEGEHMSVAQFLSALHSEVLELHGEVRNFTSLLRCTCLTHLRQRSEAPETIAAE